jgi:KUP system potassium uptake protein
MANYLLAIGTVVITAVFNNTTSLGQAYGVCVMFVTFFDTTMVALVALIVWRVRPYLVFLPWLIFAALDGTFLSSALTKFPHGAWFTVTLAIVLSCIFILWRFGKESQWTAEAVDRHSLSTFVKKDSEGTVRLTGLGREALTVTRGLGIFFDKGGIKTPLVFSQFIQKLVSMPQVIVFFHMRPLEYPTIPAEERFVVSRIRFLPNTYRIVVRHGFMDQVITDDLAALMFRHLREYVVREHNDPDAARVEPSTEANSTVESDKGASPSEEAINTLDLAELQEAYNHRVLYIIGKEQMKVRPNSAFWRVALLKVFLFLRDYSRTKMQNLKIDTDKLVEIGFVKEV